MRECIQKEEAAQDDVPKASSAMSDNGAPLGRKKDELFSDDVLDSGSMSVSDSPQVAMGTGPADLCEASRQDGDYEDVVVKGGDEDFQDVVRAGRSAIDLNCACTADGRSITQVPGTLVNLHTPVANITCKDVSGKHEIQTASSTDMDCVPTECLTDMSADSTEDSVNVVLGLTYSIGTLAAVKEDVDVTGTGVPRTSENAGLLEAPAVPSTIEKGAGVDTTEILSTANAMEAESSVVDSSHTLGMSGTFFGVKERGNVRHKLSSTGQQTRTVKRHVVKCFLQNMSSGKGRNTRHRCAVCAQYFASKQGLTYHMIQKQHIIVQHYQCITCKCVFKDKGDLDAHLETRPIDDNSEHGGHSKPQSADNKRHIEVQLKTQSKSGTSKGRIKGRTRKHNCSSCGCSFTRKRDLKGHLKSHMSDGKSMTMDKSRKETGLTAQTNVKPQPCSMCDRVFDTQADLESHTATHDTGSSSVRQTLNGSFASGGGSATIPSTGQCCLSCPECGESLASSNDLEDHLADHEMVQPYMCMECNKKFPTRRALTMHMRNHGTKQHVCAHCSMAFVTSYNLKRHIRSHTGVRPYSCTLCDKAFAEKKTLTYHMSKHSGDKPFTCHVCEKSYTQKPNLKYHLKTVHSDQPLVPRKFKCLQCPKAFRRACELRRHALLHSEKKPFKCDVCDDTFPRQDYLDVHREVQHGPKNYQCSVCGKLFALRSSLIRHAQVHSQAKPFACEVCGKKFGFKFTLKTHLRTHAKEK